MSDVETDKFYVVINEEEQYSIWEAHRAIPEGWFPVGDQRTKRECLDYIDEVWVDLRPKSARN